MPVDLTQSLVIGISSRALFNLEKEDRIFREEGLEAYNRYQIEHEEEVLPPGAGFPLVQAILRLNTLVSEKRQAEVVIMSQNNADTSLRIFNSIRHYNLDISRAALTSGAPLAPYLRAFDVDLFLSATELDVQKAIDAGIAAALIYEPPQNFNPLTDQLRIAFDGDAVLFNDEAEKIYQNFGLEAFVAHEAAYASQPLPEGPFAKLLKTLSYLQSGLQIEPSPLRTALVTARSSPAHERVIRTLRTWGVRIDEAFFMGGVSKTEILKAFGAHIFFDDQDAHLRGASQVVPSARVPYPSQQTVEAIIDNDGIPSNDQELIQVGG
uniref:5'-nucleotidase n=1 Tax=Cyanothece sp. (strain PCC 7425 / ATCC 29141) TaxID=395961 RepID=B8HQ38_CYAP4